MKRTAQIIFAVLPLGLAVTGSVAATGPHAMPAPPAKSSGTLVLTRWSVDAGGGAITNGAGLALHGTVGQADVSKASNSDLVLRGGFWRTRVAAPDAMFQNGFE